MSDRDDDARRDRGERRAAENDPARDIDPRHGGEVAPRRWRPAPGKRTLTQRLSGAGSAGLSAGQLVEQAQLHLGSAERGPLEKLEAIARRGDADAAGHAWTELRSYLAIVEQSLQDAEARAQDPAAADIIRDDALATRRFAAEVGAEGFALLDQVDPALARESIWERGLIGPGFGSPIPPLAQVEIDADGGGDRESPTAA